MVLHCRNREREEGKAIFPVPFSCERCYAFKDEQWQLANEGTKSICPFCSMHNGCALKDYGILKTQRREFESSPQVGRLNASLTFQWLLKGFSVLPEFGEDNKQIKPWNRGLLLERSTGHTVSLTQGWQIFVLANTESEETLNCFLMLINSQFTIRICERSITKYRSLFSFSFEHHRMTQVGLDKVLAFVSTTP